MIEQSKNAAQQAAHQASCPKQTQGTAHGPKLHSRLQASGGPVTSLHSRFLPPSEQNKETAEMPSTGSTTRPTWWYLSQPIMLTRHRDPALMSPHRAFRADCKTGGSQRPKAQLLLEAACARLC